MFIFKIKQRIQIGKKIIGIYKHAGKVRKNVFTAWQKIGM
jgi:hypothetical protein